jgi:lysophospholipase L1-like esterase
MQAPHMPPRPARRRAGVALAMAVATAGLHDVRRLPIADRNGDGTLAIVCIGDSNTAAGWPTPSTQRWCEMAATMLADTTHGCPWPRLSWRNVALGGATATRPREQWPWGPWYVAQARASGAELILAAFGTNDLQRQRRRPAQVALAHAKLARDAAPIPLVVALVPPYLASDGGVPHVVDETNALLRAHVAPDRLLDFATGFDRTSLAPDGIHLTEAAQQRRAVEGVRVLRRLLADAFGPCVAS